MAHRSMIVCDHCGTEAKTEGGPYPEGWALVGLSKWSRISGGSLTKDHRECDVCPRCFVKIEAAVAPR